MTHSPDAPSDNLEEIRAKVTGKLDVFIRATHPGAPLDAPLHAINWFSTRMEWLYHIYNRFAVKSVLRIGGYPVFKAKVKRVLRDDGNLRREILLIVRYPSGQQFMSLLESTRFKIVSLLRVFSVADFTFGFTQKIEGDSEPKPSLHYAVHHFTLEAASKTRREQDEILARIKECLPTSITITYAGLMIATLSSQKMGAPPKQVPNIMDGIVVFQSNEEQTLVELFGTKAYGDVFAALPSSFTALLTAYAL